MLFTILSAFSALSESNQGLIQRIVSRCLFPSELVADYETFFTSGTAKTVTPLIESIKDTQVRSYYPLLFRIAVTSLPAQVHFPFFKHLCEAKDVSTSIKTEMLQIINEKQIYKAAHTDESRSQLEYLRLLFNRSTAINDPEIFDMWNVLARIEYLILDAHLDLVIPRILQVFLFSA